MELEAPSLNMRFIGKDEILSRPTCPSETRECLNPLAIPIGARTLVPDGLFGLEYAGKGYRFFVLEADRNTESIRSRTRDATTFAKKFDDYRTIIRDRLFNARWGVPNLSVLTVTTNAGHASNLIKVLQQLIGNEHQDRFLFQREIAFGANWRVPKNVLADLLRKPWDRAGGVKQITEP
jgi:hypothetical protein